LTISWKKDLKKTGRYGAIYEYYGKFSCIQKISEIQSTAMNNSDERKV